MKLSCVQWKLDLELGKVHVVFAYYNRSLVILPDLPPFPSLFLPSSLQAVTKCQTLMDLLSFHPRMQLRDLNWVLIGHRYQGMANGGGGGGGKESEIFMLTIDWSCLF